MESFTLRNLSFTYPNRTEKTLDGITLTIRKGAFVTLCGKSGCGKTTLLRLLKPCLAPHGTTEGDILFEGKPFSTYTAREQAARIGFVMQSPDDQIVTDKVWHELAFGLESLGCPTPEIRARVSEMASFFGIQSWFHKNVTELSGGQKQLLNLASVMVMQPSVLILDEPTSQLDPIAAQEFIKTLEKINRELGTTVIVSEHRLDEAFPVSDSVIVMDKGRIVADAAPQKVGGILRETGHEMYLAMPKPMQIYSAVECGKNAPLTVREGRLWLEEYVKTHAVNAEDIPEETSFLEGETAVELQDVSFRYEKNQQDVLSGLFVRVQKGELFALMGGNGTGKTTALQLMAGLLTPQRGKVLVEGQPISKRRHIYGGVLALLPQSPETVFSQKTVLAELAEMVSDKELTGREKDEKVQAIAEKCRIEHLLERHPYDLSGGEQQRAALAKILLSEPKILLLDEPTKGMDAHFKEEFADILKDLKTNEITVIMVSHDIEFCAANASRCALMFDGSITSAGGPRTFFAGKSFYTTVANRVARTVFPNAVLTEDVVAACGGVLPEKPVLPKKPPRPEKKTEAETKADRKLHPARLFFGSFFALLFLLTTLSFLTGTTFLPAAIYNALGEGGVQILGLSEAAAALLCFFSKRGREIAASQPKTEQKQTKTHVFSTLFILLAIPLTLFWGIKFLGDRKYYVISLLILLETMLPFFAAFEKRRPRARELVIISVLCAIAVSGRAAFFMLPQFKPVAAIVILSGLAFGGETGFLVGAVTGFVSNFFFGQGPWTPWQMVAFGLIGFAAGVLSRCGFLRKTKTTLSIFGFLSTLLIYGGIVNLSSVMMWQAAITKEMVASAYLAGLSFDLAHAASTAFFLWCIAEPMMEKLERVKMKYGLYV